MLGNTFVGTNVSQTFSDPSQVPLSRLKQRAQGEMGNIRVQSTTTGFVGREGSGCEARPLDLFKVFPGHHTRLMRVARDAWPW